jgi:hypothetical protein
LRFFEDFAFASLFIQRRVALLCLAACAPHKRRHAYGLLLLLLCAQLRCTAMREQVGVRWPCINNEAHRRQAVRRTLSPIFAQQCRRTAVLAVDC